jgi:hypothetical protein
MEIYFPDKKLFERSKDDIYRVLLTYGMFVPEIHISELFGFFLKLKKKDIIYNGKNN